MASNIITHVHSSHKIHYNQPSLYQCNSCNKFTKSLKFTKGHMFILSLLFPYTFFDSTGTADHSFANTLLSWFLTSYCPCLLLFIWSFSSSHHCGLFFFRLSLTTEFMALSSMPLIYNLSPSDQNHSHSINYELHFDKPNAQ